MGIAQEHLFVKSKQNDIQLKTQIQINGHWAQLCFWHYEDSFFVQYFQSFYCYGYNLRKLTKIYAKYKFFFQIILSIAKLAQ